MPKIVKINKILREKNGEYSVAVGIGIVQFS